MSALSHAPVSRFRGPRKRPVPSLAQHSSYSWHVFVVRAHFTSCWNFLEPSSVCFCDSQMPETVSAATLMSPWQIAVSLSLEQVDTAGPGTKRLLPPHNVMLGGFFDESPGILLSCHYRV